MSTVLFVLSIFCLCIEGHFSAQDRQWALDDAVQNCTQKCKKECEACETPTTCSDDEIQCGEAPPEFGPDCPPSEICAQSGCECKYTVKGYYENKVRVITLTF